MAKHPFYGFVPSNWFYVLQMQHCFGGFTLNQVGSYHGMACMGMCYGGYVSTVADQGGSEEEEEAGVI